MNKKAYIIITGVLFGLVTIGQLIRLAFQVPVQVCTINLPMWPSVLAILFALLFCIWAFLIARKL
ncbi:hypothetical protein ACFLRZ_02300 [Bacteroidota bacterium]